MATATETRATAATARPPRARRASAIRVARVIWYREVLTYFRDRTRFVVSMVMPVLMLVVFGGGFSRTIGTFQEGINYRQFIFPGLIAMTILFNALFSGVSIIWDREFGFLREILVAPTSRTAIAAGKLTGGASIAVAHGVAMFIFAPFLGVHFSVLVMLELTGVMFVFGLAMTSVGIAIASRVHSMQTFQIITQTTIMPALFLSGIFFPVNNVPVWMEVLSKLNPVTYAVVPIRTISLGAELNNVTLPSGTAPTVGVELFGHVLSTMESLGIMVAFGVLMLTIAVQSLRREG